MTCIGDSKVWPSGVSNLLNPSGAVSHHAIDRKVNEEPSAKQGASKT
jgi:hypothetical protein